MKYFWNDRILTLNFSSEILCKKKFHMSFILLQKKKQLFWLPISKTKESLIEHSWERSQWKYYENLVYWIILLWDARMI